MSLPEPVTTAIYPLRTAKYERMLQLAVVVLLLVILPVLTGCIRRIHAAVFSFIAGVTPPIAMLGRSLL